MDEVHERTDAECDAKLYHIRLLSQRLCLLLLKKTSDVKKQFKGKRNNDLLRVERYLFKVFPHVLMMPAII